MKYPLSVITCLVLALLFCACAPATPQIVEKLIVQTVEVEKEVVRTVEVEKIIEREIVQTVQVERIVEKIVTVVPTPASELRPKYGGTVVLTTGEGLIGPAGDFDADSTHDIRLMSLYLDQLMLQLEDGTIVPALATRIEASEDGLTWTIQLRQTAKWHDGQPVLADDLIYTIETICSGKTTPPAPLNQLSNLEGCLDYREGSTQGVTGLRKVDDFTVELKTIEANSALRYQLIRLHPVPSHFWQDVPLDGLLNHPRWLDRPIGSGPFKMVNYAQDLVAEFEAFEDYYRGRPYLDKVIVRFAPGDASLVGLEAGEVDHVPSIKIPDALRLSEDPRFTVLAWERPTMWSMYPHFYHETLRDPQVLHALTYAIDRDTINKIVFGGYGGSNVKNFYKPGTWAANPELPIANHNPEKARALLQELNFDFGKPMGMFVMSTYPAMVETAQIIQANLKDVGITLDIYPGEEAIILDEWVRNRDKLWFTIFAMGGTPPDPFLDVVYLKSDRMDNWGWYLCYWASPAVLGEKTGQEVCGNYQYGSSVLDELLDQALATGNQEILQELLWKIDEWLWENPPSIPVISPAELQIWNSRVHGIRTEFDLRHWRHPEGWWVE